MAPSFPKSDSFHVHASSLYTSQSPRELNVNRKPPYPKVINKKSKRENAFFEARGNTWSLEDATFDRQRPLAS